MSGLAWDSASLSSVERQRGPIKFVHRSHVTKLCGQASWYCIPRDRQPLLTKKSQSNILVNAMGQNQGHRALLRCYQGGKEQASLHYQASLCPCTPSVGTWTQTQAETMKNMKERKQVPSGHQKAPPCFLTTAPDAAGNYQSLPCPLA